MPSSARVALAASREGRGGFGGRLYRRTQRPPCVKGPQGSAACGGRSDRSGPAAACLGGPQRGPPRLRGNPELSAARLTGGLTEEFSVPLELTTPPALRATSPYTGEALAAAFGKGALAALAWTRNYALALRHPPKGRRQSKGPGFHFLKTGALRSMDL